MRPAGLRADGAGGDVVGVVRDDYLPPSVQARRPTAVPTDEDLRRITGMD
ncbi:hypothetical protein [Plantactinospora sp. DSM 117369]